MKLGLSTYSLQPLLQSGEMNVSQAFRWIAEQGGEHVEVCAIGVLNLLNFPEKVEEVVSASKAAGLSISNYCVGGNFVQPDEEAYRQEIETVKKHVEIASALGVRTMRHDVASRPKTEGTVEQFRSDLPKLVEACREIADYAAGFGITTSVENHGFYLQSSERVLTLVHEVDRPNFKATLDIGNFLCVDESPAPSVRRTLPHACMVHLKDFYVRPVTRNPGAGWFQSKDGNYLRGAIVGQGDIDIYEVLGIIRESGYDGFVSIEFEGMEENRKGSKIGLENVRRIWSEISASTQ